MEAEIIAVGTELLLGDILNTNAQFLSRELAALGVNVHFQTVVGDNPARLTQAIEIARSRCNLLVFSGGLGPTDDDLTKQTVAAAFGDTLQFDAQEYARIEAFFARWGRTMPESNKKQAYVPVCGRKLPNENGTAPGMLFEDAAKPGHYAVLLPGPPAELQPMFLQWVKPWLQQQSGCVLHSRTLRVTGMGESHVEQRVAPLLQSSNPTAALYAKTAEVVIRITAQAETQAQAEALCSTRAQAFYALLGEYVYADSTPQPPQAWVQQAESLEQAVVQALTAKGLTLATAESCTGGLVAQRITAVAGASAVFGYGAVTYANEAKQRALGVKQETLAQYGAVSSQVAAEMALGVRHAAQASIGVALTGIAGPGGGTPEKPVGLVYVAAANADSVYVQRLLVTNRPRDTVRATAAQAALEMVRRLALGLPQPASTRFSHTEPARLAADIQTNIKDV